MREFQASSMQAAIYAESMDILPVEVIQISFNFGEPVNVKLVQKSWVLVTRRHGLLRASFNRKTDNALSFYEHEACEATWNVLHWCNLSREEISTQWSQLQAEDAVQPIDLNRPPLYRFHIVELPEKMHHFLWTCHSILLDRESIFLVLRDWLLFYEGLLYGHQLVLQESPSYADAIGSIDGDDSTAARQYWQGLFQKSTIVSSISYDAKNTENSSTSLPWKHECLLLEREISARLIQSARLADSSVSTLLAAAWGLALGRLSVNGETIFGIYRSCRHLAGHQATEAVGLFDSLLPISIQVPEHLTCETWLRSLQKELLNTTSCLLASVQGGLDYYPGIPLGSTLHYSPESLNDRIRACLPQWMRFDACVRNNSRFPMQIWAWGQERIAITFEYNPGRIATRIVSHLFERLLKAVHCFLEPSTLISEISLSLLYEEEESVSLGVSPEQPTFPNLFTALTRIAQLHGACPFVERGSDALSFSSVETYSTQFATFLNNRSIGNGMIIALIMLPSPWMLVALIGTLRAGCICLPLDPAALPVDLEEYLSKYQVSAVLTDKNGEGMPEKVRQTLFVLKKSLWRKILSLPKQVLPTLSTTIHALSVLRSNGDRKMISYEELQTIAENAAHTYHARSGDRILCHHLQGSAMATEEYFIALLTGATLVFPESNVKSTRTAFQETLASTNVTHLRLTAAFWSQWVHYLSELQHFPPCTLRRIIIEAGHISRSIISKWKEQNQGKADCIVFYSFSDFVGAGTVTDRLDAPELSEIGLVCGRPQPGVAIFLTDSRYRLLPSYSPGMLACCSYGNEIRQHERSTVITIGNNEASWEVFITNELAQWNREGQLVLISQPHSQLPDGFDWKSLRQIEDTLTAHPSLVDSIVRSVTTFGTQSCLGAWIIPYDSCGPLPTKLNQYLKDRLPQHLIPEQFSIVNRFHLDAFDQIDSLSLASPKPWQTIASSTTRQVVPTFGVTASPGQSSPIVTLQVGGDKEFYFVHAGRGLADDYRPIAQALPCQYGVHCLMIPKRRFHSSVTVEAVASGLVCALREHMPSRFAIIGIGVGAIFAWELAHQLNQKNEKNRPPLILFEIPSASRKGIPKWLQGFKKIFILEGKEKENSKSPKNLSEIISSYQAPALQLQPYFFISGHPDPKWVQRAPSGKWHTLHLGGKSPLDTPAEVAKILTEVITSL